MRILFICNQNLNRSKTAEILFKDRFETKSAGLYNAKPVTRREIAWADVIMVMENAHRKELAIRFPSLALQKRILSLDIDDVYFFNEPELIELLEKRVTKSL